MASKDKRSPFSYRWRSLPFLIALSLIFVATVPLFVTFIFLSTQTTPTLIDQANKAMTNDAQTRVQLINNYLQERLLDVKTVQQAASQVPNVQSMLTVDTPGSAAFQLDATIGGYYVVEIGMIRSKDYRDWAIFSKTGQLLLAYPTRDLVQPHGTSLIPPSALKMVNAGKSFISPVYYSPQTHVSSVDIYAPIMQSSSAMQAQQAAAAAQQGTAGAQSAQQAAVAAQQGTAGAQSAQQVAAAAQAAQRAAAAPQKPIGVLRATLDLEYVTSIVQGDSGSNGNGSYAYIVDNNGIRIIDPHDDQLFTSVAPVTESVQQQVKSEERFGVVQPVSVIADPPLARSLSSNKQSSSFQEQPAGETSQFQVLRQDLNPNIVPWHYVVLSPVLTETAVANQQQMNIMIVAILTTILVIVIGFLVGSGISRPIQRAVNSLYQSSEDLKVLAVQQQDSASSQMWVVESSQVGQGSVRYYSHATELASTELAQKLEELVHSWSYLDMQDRIQRLGKIVELAQYVRQASSYLGKSNQQLDTALNLATEVAEQLKEGSRSAKESAERLEMIVRDLLAVIGR